MSRFYFILPLALATILSPTVMEATAAELEGCLSRLPDGTLQLGGVPSGESYVLHGETKLLERHISQLVRITGRAETGITAQSTPVFTVDTIRAVAGSCNAVLPPTQVETIGGKVGANVTATPVTTSASMDETTPGFQTETLPPNTAAQYLERPNYAPLEPDQASESVTAAERNAQAATRAEILPKGSLGVSNSSAAPSLPGSAQVRD